MIGSPAFTDAAMVGAAAAARRIEIIAGFIFFVSFAIEVVPPGETVWRLG